MKYQPYKSCHCLRCRNEWRSSNAKAGTTHRKRWAHKMFRRLVKDALRRELAGECVSHVIVHYSPYA